MIEVRNYDAPERDLRSLDGRMQITPGVQGSKIGQATPKSAHQMRSKSQAAWETAAKCATLTEEFPTSANIMRAFEMRGSR